MRAWEKHRSACLNYQDLEPNKVIVLKPMCSWFGHRISTWLPTCSLGFQHLQQSRNFEIGLFIIYNIILHEELCYVSVYPYASSFPINIDYCRKEVVPWTTGRRQGAVELTQNRCQSSQKHPRLCVQPILSTSEQAMSCVMFVNDTEAIKFL